MRKFKSILLLLALTFTTSVAFGAYHPPGDYKQTSVVNHDPGFTLDNVSMEAGCQVAVVPSPSVGFDLPEPVLVLVTKRSALKLNPSYIIAYKGEAALSVPVAHSFRLRSYFNYSAAIKEKIYLYNCSIRQCFC